MRAPRRRPRGRPKSIGPLKTPIQIRLDADVVETLRASGPGWQTRVNHLLRDHVITPRGGK